ncbi:MAG: phosphatidate cytidylyltransferase [Novosphingobium sp.]
MVVGKGSRSAELKVRTRSALVMLAVAGSALWLGGWIWLLFVGLVALGVLWEWRGLAVRFVESGMARGLWNVGGIVYIGTAVSILGILRLGQDGIMAVLHVVLAVIATDIGAYFTGRTFGGPKIAPAISPSKTWSGLAGGMALAALAMVALTAFPNDGKSAVSPALAALGGAMAAIVAQAGDFFESWMKRRAGVKDSGRLIPGHGGLFDRVDGLLAVLFVVGILTLVPWAASGG